MQSWGSTTGRENSGAPMIDSNTNSMVQTGKWVEMLVSKILNLRQNWIQQKVFQVIYHAAQTFNRLLHQMTSNASLRESWRKIASSLGAVPEFVLFQLHFTPIHGSSVPVENRKFDDLLSKVLGNEGTETCKDTGAGVIAYAMNIRPLLIFPFTFPFYISLMRENIRHTILSECEERKEI